MPRQPGFWTPWLLQFVLRKRHDRHEHYTARTRGAICEAELRTSQKSLLRQCVGEDIVQRLEHDRAYPRYFSALRGKCTLHLRDRRCHPQVPRCFRIDLDTAHHSPGGTYCNQDT